jgi:carbon monoxide dehydrogenase subunit G
MDFTGRYTIPAPPEAVWAALNDPEVLKACIPGCEYLAKLDATHFDAVATLKIGPVKATFKAAIEQTDLDPPRRCVLKGVGQGGVAGFARGEAEVTLTPETGGTVLSYAAKATIGGKLAQIGQRLIDGAAKQVADDFFSRFATLVAAPAEPVEPPLPAIEEPEIVSLQEAVVTAPQGVAREGLAPQIWVIGLVAIIAILLVIFGMMR